MHAPPLYSSARFRLDFRLQIHSFIFRLRILNKTLRLISQLISQTRLRASFRSLLFHSDSGYYRSQALRSSSVLLFHLSSRRTMVSFEMNDRKKIGIGLTGFGVFFSFLGIIFFFDKGLLAMGNILFFSGLTITIGLKSTMQFFMKRQNFKGTVSFGVGFFLVVIGWPIIGMLLEAYGFIVLFSGFWPTLAVFLQRIPILGWLFQQPYIRSILERYRGGRRVPV